MFGALDTKQLDEVKNKFSDVLKFDGKRIGVNIDNISEVQDYIDKLTSLNHETIEPEINLSNVNEEMKSLSEKVVLPKPEENYFKDIPNGESKVNLDTSPALEEITTLKQAVKNAIDEIGRQFPSIQEKLSKIKVNTANWINSSPLKQKIESDIVPVVKQKLESVKVNTADWIDKNWVIGRAREIASGFKDSFSQGLGKMGNIGNSLAIPFDMLKEKISSANSKINNLFNGIKSGASKAGGFFNKIISPLKNIKKNSDTASKSLKGMGNLGNSFEKGISSIKRFAMSLLSIRGAYNAVSKAASAYLSYDTQLSDSIQNSWNVLGSLLAPALEYVASIFAKVVSYIASFVKALTGIDLVARANTKALNNQTKASKKAKQENHQLTGIDDLNNLTTNKDSGDSGGSDLKPITVESMDVDTAPFEKALNKIKKILSRLFEPMKKAWNNVGQGVISSMITAFNNVKQAVIDIGTSFMSVWTNGTGEQFCTNILLIIQQIFDMIGNIALAFDNAWNHAGAGTALIQAYFDAFNSALEFIQAIGNSINEVFSNGTLETTFSNLIGIFTNIYESIDGIYTALTNAWNAGGKGTAIFQSIADIINDILGFIDSVTGSISQWVVSESFQQAIDSVLSVIRDIFGISKEIADWVLSMYDKYLKPVIEDKLLPAISDIITDIREIWDTVKPIIDKIIQEVQKYLEPVIKGLCTVIGGIIDIAKGIIDFITGIFTGNWSKAFNGLKTVVSGVLNTIKGAFSTVFNAIWGVVKGILNGIIGGFEGMVNFAINALNKLIKPLTKVGNTILKTIGIKNFSFSEIPKVSLPRLATGNVATEETVAIFGEYSNAKSNPEITSPVSLMKESFREVLSEFELSGTKYERLVINYLGKNILDENIDYINEQQRIKGVQIIKEA